jgi:hypothetical protein
MESLPAYIIQEVSLQKRCPNCRLLGKAQGSNGIAGTTPHTITRAHSLYILRIQSQTDWQIIYLPNPRKNSFTYQGGKIYIRAKEVQLFNNITNSCYSSVSGNSGIPSGKNLESPIQMTVCLKWITLVPQVRQLALAIAQGDERRYYPVFRKIEKSAFFSLVTLDFTGKVFLGWVSRIKFDYVYIESGFTLP